jgi:response regulator RpfG family c-di-GMP phosphodiesterase
MAIKTADEVLKNPMSSVSEILKNKLGYSKGVKGFFTDPWNLLLMGQPLGLASRVLYKYLKNKERQRQEMEMMKRNIIAKQQAIIKKMEEENYQNEQQNKNLQEAVDFLEETLKRIEESKNKKRP